MNNGQSISDTSHQHDWRIAPSKPFRTDSTGETKQYMLKCPTCPATGWGHEHTDVSTWPKWIGTVDEIEL